MLGIFDVLEYSKNSLVSLNIKYLVDYVAVFLQQLNSHESKICLHINRLDQVKSKEKYFFLCMALNIMLSDDYKNLSLRNKNFWWIYIDVVHFPQRITMQSVSNCWLQLSRCTNFKKYCPSK